MKPKNRKEILDICQEHFWYYSKLTKFLIVISVVLSISIFALYLWKWVLPIASGIIYGTIVGWDILWNIFLVYIFYKVLCAVNLIFVCIGGVAMCGEENWETDDFAIAWMNAYELYGKK
jgi:hypothetical protein